jgi:hypothetical protein
MSTNCPQCGSQGRIANLALLDLYRCTNWKCRTEYFVQRKRCGACNEEIADENEYCYFHAYLGNDPPPPRREDFCKVCLNHVSEGIEYCADHERQFREEQEEYMRKFEADFRDRNK